MNVLVLSNTFPDKDNLSFGDIFVKEQIKYLRKYVDNIYVVIPVPYGRDLLKKEKHTDYQFDNVQVFFTKFPMLPIYTPHAQSIWAKFGKNAVLRTVRKHEISFDLIHAHYTWRGGAIAAEIKKEMNVPVVLTEHAHESIYPLIKKRDRFIVDTWANVDAIIRVNQTDMPLFSEVTSSEKLFYIPDGYDPDKVKNISKKEAREILKLPIDKKVLFNLGHLDKYKGQIFLIRAMKEVIKKRSDVICIIGGDGPLRTELENEIKHLGLTEYVKLIGRVPHDKISLWYSAADLFVLPSLYESFGIVQIEAMACGKPVVATRNGGSEQIITSEDYGLLCEPGDSHGLAKNILLALDKEWDADKIRAYAERFRWDNIAKQIVELYERVRSRYNH